MDKMQKVFAHRCPLALNPGVIKKEPDLFWKGMSSIFEKALGSENSNYGIESYYIEKQDDNAFSRIVNYGKFFVHDTVKRINNKTIGIFVEAGDKWPESVLYIILEEDEKGSYNVLFQYEEPSAWQDDIFHQMRAQVCAEKDERLVAQFCKIVKRMLKK